MWLEFFGAANIFKSLTRILGCVVFLLLIGIVLFKTLRWGLNLPQNPRDFDPKINSVSFETDSWRVTLSSEGWFSVEEERGEPLAICHATKLKNVSQLWAGAQLCLFSDHLGDGFLWGRVRFAELGYSSGPYQFEPFQLILGYVKDNNHGHPYEDFCDFERAIAFREFILRFQVADLSRPLFLGELSCDHPESIARTPRWLCVRHEFRRPGTRSLVHSKKDLDLDKCRTYCATGAACSWIDERGEISRLF